jgi:hypothetical protein
MINQQGGLHMRIIFALLAALLFGTPANAADVFSSKDTVGEVASNPFGGLYFGVNGGGQFTSIAISAPGYDELFDGISNDGFVGGGHIGFNLCPTGNRLCAGAFFEGGWSNGETTFADVDVLKFKAYRQLGVLGGSLVGKSTFVDIHAAYEWQDWEASNGYDDIDVDVAMWVFGAGIQTMIAENTSFGIKLDYLVLDSAEAKGAGDLTKALDQTEALRVQGKLSYYPAVTRAGLESLVRR